MKQLTVKKLSIKYTYGAMAISNLSFIAADNAISAVLGGEEAGKTSLLKCLAGLEKPCCGEVLLNGVDIFGASIKKRNFCFVAAEGMFFNRRSVYFNLAYPLKIRKVKKNEISEKIKSASEKVELNASVWKTNINKITPIDRIKTAFARCFLRKADVYLFDNPLKALSDAERMEMFKFLHKMMLELSEFAVVIYATDVGAECEIMDCQTILLNYGISLQQGCVKDIYNEPQSLLALEKLHGEVEKSEACIVLDGENLYLEYFGKSIILDRDKLISEIFIGKPLWVASVNSKLKIFDAKSERLIYFN